MYLLYLAKMKERGRPFFKGTGEDIARWDYPKSHLVFFYLWTVAYLNMLLCFQSKMSFNRLFWLFILIYFRHFTFWNEIAFSQPLHQFSVSHGATSTGYPSREVCTNLQFSLVKLWNIIWTYGGFNLQITTSKSTHIVFILFEIAWVEI